MQAGDIKMLPKNQNGAAALEFLIVLPILLLFLFGGIEFGAIFYNKQVLTNASREAARAGITHKNTGITAEQIKTIAKDYCNNRLVGFGSSVVVDEDNVTIFPNNFDDPNIKVIDLKVEIVIEKYKLVFASIMGLDILYEVPDLKNIINLSASTTMRMEPKLN